MLITINAALFLIVREVIFYPKIGVQNSLGPLEKPREIADYVLKSTQGTGT